LKKLYLESLEYIHSTEHQLLQPLDEQIGLLNRNATLIDSVVDNMNGDDRTLGLVLPEADRICAEMKPPRATIPKFELLTEDSNIPLCNVSLVRKGAKTRFSSAENTRYHFKYFINLRLKGDKKPSEKERSTTSTRDTSSCSTPKETFNRTTGARNSQKRE
jgi:hypothetical protein